MPSNSPKTGSPRHQSPYSASPYGVGANQDFRCTCGYRFIGKSATCPNCGNLAKSEGEITRKVDDAPDLFKAG